MKHSIACFFAPGVVIEARNRSSQSVASCMTHPTIEVFHTRDQNHVTAGGDSILGVKLCNSRRGSGIDMLSKLAANLVRASLGLM